MSQLWCCRVGLVLAIGCASDEDAVDGDTSGSSSMSPSDASTGDSGTGAGPTSASTSAGTTTATPTSETDGGSSGDASDESSGGSSGSSFEADIWPIFIEMRDPPFTFGGNSCVTEGTCHGSDTPGANLPMYDAASTYAALIDVPSTTGLCAGTLRVVAGAPDDSCLVLFYEGRLRDSLGWVEQPEIDTVRAWIEAGAAP